MYAAKRDVPGELVAKDYWLAQSGATFCNARASAGPLSTVPRAFRLLIDLPGSFPPYAFVLLAHKGAQILPSKTSIEALSVSKLSLALRANFVVPGPDFQLLERLPDQDD